MIEVCMPYLGAIKTLIQDAFPYSKVDVWAEESRFSKAIAIKAVVNNDGAYTVIYPDSMCTEAHIAELLIALLKERKAKNETN